MTSATRRPDDHEPDGVDPACGARALSDTAAARVLGEVLRSCPGRVVAFDLDSTLLDNRPRNARIMREFGHAVDEPCLAAARPAHWADWSARRAMANIGLAPALVETHIAAYESFWEERFFTGEYCEADAAVAGAAGFANAVRDAGGTVVYLTGRPSPMRAGTVRSLRTLGFPVPGEEATELRMRASPFDSDDCFKRTAIPALSDVAPVAAAFDNEPTHINAYRSLLPDARCVHLLTDHSGRAVPLLEGIVSIRRFPATASIGPVDPAASADPVAMRDGRRR